MSKVAASYYPRHINQYTPKMGYAVDVAHGGPTFVNFGTPAIADPNGILVGASATTTVQTYTSTDWAAAFNALDSETGKMDALFGRNVTMVGTAGSDHVVTVTGRDYLGQPMKENLTLSGTTPQNGLKAFMYIDEVSVAVGASGDTFDMGWGDVLGMPYKCIKVLSEEADGAIEATLGTLVTPVLTDPQTIATGDPRGTYNPQTTLDGAIEITGRFMFDNDLNAAGNGGLHGIAHFFS